MPNLHHLRIYARSEADGAGPTNTAYSLAFNILLAIGVVLVLASLLSAALCRSVCRLVTWYNFMGSMGVSCFSFLILAGHQTGTEPPYDLCLASATFGISALVLVAVTALTYSIEILLTVTLILKASYSQPKYYARVLLVVPYLMYLLTVTGVFAVGMTGRSQVHPNPSYLFCQLSNQSMWVPGVPVEDSSHG
ncbi:hypothetical protein HGRIS_000447 [Hohenbuehelia grisea]|uniref:Uncharacterized protein n=1 Tax=Hohenbuehelia grisea TaxID=104357 RepID=A0ABR3JRQ2_9AGAR